LTEKKKEKSNATTLWGKGLEGTEENKRVDWGGPNKRRQKRGGGDSRERATLSEKHAQLEKGQDNFLRRMGLVQSYKKGEKGYKEEGTDIPGGPRGRDMTFL